MQKLFHTSLLYFVLLWRQIPVPRVVYGTDDFSNDLFIVRGLGLNLLRRHFIHMYINLNWGSRDLGVTKEFSKVCSTIHVEMCPFFIRIAKNGNKTTLLLPFHISTSPHLPIENQPAVIFHQARSSLTTPSLPSPWRATCWAGEDTLSVNVIFGWMFWSMLIAKSLTMAQMKKTAMGQFNYSTVLS